MLTKPPSSADKPACIPQRAAATSAMATVAQACHRNTLRIALLCSKNTIDVPRCKARRWIVIAFVASGQRKPVRRVKHRAHSLAQLRQERFEVFEARVV